MKTVALVPQSIYDFHKKDFTLNSVLVYVLLMPTQSQKIISEFFIFNVFFSVLEAN